MSINQHSQKAIEIEERLLKKAEKHGRLDEMEERIKRRITKIHNDAAQDRPLIRIFALQTEGQDRDQQAQQLINEKEGKTNGSLGCFVAEIDDEGYLLN